MERADQVAALLRRYLLLQDASETDDLPDSLLSESIDLARELAKERLPEEAAAKVEVGLGTDLAERFRRTGDVADIDAAIALGRARISRGHDLTWVTDRVNLAAALRASWNFTDRVEHLDEAIEVLQAAATAGGIDDEGRAWIAGNLASGYSERFDLRREPADDLRSAIAEYRVALTSSDPVLAAGARAGLASTLLDAYRTGSGGEPELAEAAVLAKAATAGPGSAISRAARWDTLARVEMARFDHDGDARHIDAAQAALSEALALVPVGSPAYGGYVSVQVQLWYVRYHQFGDRRDLDAAIATAQEALKKVGRDRQNAGVLTNELCLTLTERFELDGNRADLDRAISAARRALGQPGLRVDIELTLRTNLVHAVHQRFELVGDRQDLADAVAEIVSVLRRSARSPERAARLNAAGTLYARKAIIAREAGRSRQAISDLTRAVGFGHEALELTEPASQDRVLYQTSLASWLMERFELSGAAADLDEAIERYEDAHALVSPGSAPAPRVAYILATACQLRHERQPGNDLTDLQRACDLWDEALAAGEPYISQFAGQRLGNIAFHIGDWDKCEQALALSLEAARVLTTQRVALADRERARFEVQGTGSVAALAAARSGAPERAVVHLEQASATLLAEAASRRSDQVSFADVAASAQALDGPLVYWAVTPAGGIALVVRPDGTVEPVELAVTTDELATALAALRAAFARDAPDQLAAWAAAVSALRDWTGRALVRPVLPVLELPSSGGLAPVGLVPVGRAASLPISTATLDRTPALFERAIPRLLPNARSLVRPRPWPPDPVACVIGDPASGAYPLSAVAGEAQEVAASYGRVHGYAPAPASDNAGCAADDLIGRLDGVDVAHLACHFDLQFDDPMASVLHAGRDIRLGELFGRRFRTPVHLVLSACDSGLTGTRLPDEAIGPAPLLLAAGARSVVAALWPVDDELAPAFMVSYHRRLAAGHDPAAALALTQREAAGDQPSFVWSAFAHSGW
jgi:tetratricopeptide (TPR) repeat protein